MGTPHAARAARIAVLLPAAALAMLGWERRWVAEDAFIDLRVVRHLLDGHGPVFNPGERVEAFTNPLWVGLLTAAAAALRPLLGDGLSLEWVAVWMGLACAVAGLALAALGASRTCGGVPLPLGAIVVAGVPAYWDFATSGLETGLALGWLGGCFWALAALPTRQMASGRATAHATALAALIGLGPLIRPDLAVLTAGLFVSLVALRRRSRSVARLVVAAVALPAAYQLFRMGYFAAVVPNTAIAKEAGALRWDQGVRYLLDFGGAYWLWLPLGLLLIALVNRVRALARGGSWGGVWLAVGPVAGGLLHACYVTGIGGDFMHARLLLPSLFAALLPVAVVPLRPASATGPSARIAAAGLPLTAALAAVIVVWAVICGASLRPPYAAAGPEPSHSVGPQGIADERGFYVRFSGRSHPVTLEDYARAPWAREGQALRHEAAMRGAVVVAARRNIGLAGYAAGPQVHLVDTLGLADPIASRLQLHARGRPGHEKELPPAWIAARFPEAVGIDTPGTGSADGPEAGHVAAAREALRCGQLAELLEAVAGSLDARRAMANVAQAWRLTRLRVPADPIAAWAALCTG